MDDRNYFDDIDSEDLCDDDVFDIADELVDKYMKENFGENNERLNGTYIMHPKAIQEVEKCEESLKACICSENLKVESEILSILKSICIRVKGKDMLVTDTKLFAELLRIGVFDFTPNDDGDVSIGVAIDGVFYKVVEDV